MIDRARALSPLLLVGLAGCFLVRPQNDPQASGQPSSPSDAPASPGAESGSSGNAGRSGAPGTSTPAGARTDDGQAGSRGTTAPPPEKIVSVSVDFRNECSEKVEYCVDSGGSTLNTSLGSNSSTSSSLGPGTKIQLKKDNRCGMTIFTVPESKERQKVVLCQR